MHDLKYKILSSRVTVVLAIPLTWLLLEEILSVYDPILALMVSFIAAFVTAILPYTAKWASNTKESFQCFSLIFLTRVSVAVLPALFSPSLLLVVVYSVVLVMCSMYVIEKKLSIARLGFHSSDLVAQVVAGLALGTVMGFAEYGILSSDMKKYLLFPQFSVNNLLWVALVMFVFVALGEEFLFRSLAQTSFQKELGHPTIAIILVSSAFAIMHLGYVTAPIKAIEILYVFIAATLIGYAFAKTKSLVLPLVAHGIANTILFGVLPFFLQGGFLRMTALEVFLTIPILQF